MVFFVWVVVFFFNIGGLGTCKAKNRFLFSLAMSHLNRGSSLLFLS